MASWLLLPAHAFTMASPQRVKLDELLSTCVDASLRGCAEIRRVQAQRVSGGAAALTIMEAKDEQELSSLLEATFSNVDAAARHVVVLFHRTKQACPKHGFFTSGPSVRTREHVAP